MPKLRNMGWYYYLKPEDYKREIMTILKFNLPREVKEFIIELLLTKLDEEIKDVIDAENDRSWKRSEIYDYIDPEC